MAVLVGLWGVVATAAVINHGPHQDRHDSVQAVSAGDEITDARPSAGRGDDVRVLRGAVESADDRHLVLEVSEGEPHRLVFGMASATIRINGKEGSVGDLRRGDVVGVVYAEAHAERMAKMVLVTDTERR